MTLPSCGVGNTYPQFGARTFKIEGLSYPSNGGPPTQTTIYRAGTRLRVETISPQRRTVIVFDPATNGAYLLDPAPTTAQRGNSGFVGVAMHIPDAQAPQPLETFWAALGASSAENLGRCVVAGQRGLEWRANAAPPGVAERTACITPDGIVLRVREGGKPVFQATRLQRGPIDASLFGIPPGYQKYEPQAVAQSTTPTTTPLQPAG